MNTQRWTFFFNNSILGPILVAARRKKGKTYLGSEIPKWVRDAAFANDRGAVTDPQTQAFIKANWISARSRRFRYKITADIGPAPERPSRMPAPPNLDWDEAYYAGNGNDGVYYGAVKQGNYWWSLATVDSDTGGFVQDLYPATRFRSYKQALIDAFYAAQDWCITNRVRPGRVPDEIKALLKR